MSSIWNILAPIKTGVVRIAGSGNQLFGTVVQHAVNQKTVTVRVSSRHWNKKYRYFQYSHKNKQVHDQYDYCVTGDKVVIKSCQKIANSKAYYVKSIVKPFSRNDHYVTQLKNKEKPQNSAQTRKVNIQQKLI